MAKKIQSSFSGRVQLEEKTPYINFSETEKITQETIDKAKDVEGVKIITG